MGGTEGDVILAPESFMMHGGETHVAQVNATLKAVILWISVGREDVPDSVYSVKMESFNNDVMLDSM
nr:hypothetical protein Iba_chr02cCG13940 [Ipomoea batatas]